MVRMVMPAPPLLLALLLRALTVMPVTSQDIVFRGQRARCPSQCEYVYDPVCGSDGVSYPNLCFFTRANCRKPSVRTVKLGSCTVPDPCSFVCDRMYNPVCGSDGVTYANPCVLLYFACYYANGLVLRHKGKCIVERPCPTSCPDDREPVCGSDGKTYDNPCFLLLKACTGRKVTTVRSGPCSKRCPRRCTREYLPVCGSDGLTYPNECVLKKRHCKDQRVSKAYDGTCGPTKRPCPTSCNFSNEPLCASDGNTYSNQCTLDVTNCHSSTTISKLYDGECVKTDNAQRKCPAHCPFIYAPVCGSDGKTYGNQCAFESASCLDPTITKLFDVACATQQIKCPTSCSANYSPVCGTDGKTYGNQCTLDTVSCKDPTIKKDFNGECGTPQRPCPDVCPTVYSPVCGTDGITYDNDCALKAASCKTPSIIIRNSGRCAKATPVTPAPRPPCASTCDRVYSPVCGSDGRTYFNLCLLNLISCREGTPLSPVREGRCDEQATAKPRCPVSCSRLYEPVCGSDGVTYDNQCFLNRVMCRNPSVTKVADGQCGPAQGDGSSTSKCIQECPFTYSPQCGSDKVTYSNECTFRNAACQDPNLTKLYNGSCR